MMAQTNFRAADMPGAKKKAPVAKAPAKKAPVAAKKAAEPVVEAPAAETE
jgi:hypothetical protein